MKMSPGQKKRPRTVSPGVQKMGPLKLDRNSVSVGAIITGNDEIITFPSPENHCNSKESVPEHVKELNLLSLGKRLLDSCKIGDVGEVRQLLKTGAPFIADWVGTSPLHFAVLDKHAEIAELLLKHGISRDVSNKVGRTPLHIAAQMGVSYMVKLLLAHGLEVNCKDMMGMAPLHWAAENGDLLTARILIDYGADCWAKNRFGKTPGMIARENHYLDMLKIIQDADSIDITTRNVRTASLRENLLIVPGNNMKPVAEIFEPPSKKKSHVERIGKKVLAITADNCRDEGPTKGADKEDVETDKISSAEEMSKDSAIRLLKSHGVAMIEPDDDTTLSSAVLGGHTIRLTDAGKLAFKSLENNCWKENQDMKSTVSQRPAKLAKRSNGSLDSNGIADNVIIGSKIPDCTIDLPSQTTNSSTIPKDVVEGTPERHNMYILRLKEKRKETLRHLEIIDNQRTIKQHELNSINQQIRMMESILHKIS